MAYTGSKAQSGRGASLSIGAAPGTLIGEITDLPFDLPEWQFADTTNLQSPIDGEQLATSRKVSSPTFKVNRVSTDEGQAAVMAAYSSGVKDTFTYALAPEAGQTTGDSLTFSAYVATASFTVSPTNVVSASIKLQTSGAVTFTPGTVAAS